MVDLSKAFDCIVHDPSLVKQSALDCDYDFLKLINSFLSSRKFRSEIGSSYSPYVNLLVEVSQGLFLILLLLNIHTCDFSLCRYESKIMDGTTLYASELDMDLVLCKLGKDAFTIFTWFEKNYFES